MAIHHESTQTSSAVRGEFCFIRKDGSRFFMSVDAVQVQKDRTIGFCVDITKRINAEQSLKQQSESLQQANQKLEEPARPSKTGSRICQPSQERIPGEHEP